MDDVICDITITSKHSCQLAQFLYKSCSCFECVYVLCIHKRCICSRAFLWWGNTSLFMQSVAWYVQWKGQWVHFQWVAELSCREAQYQSLRVPGVQHGTMDVFEPKQRVAVSEDTERVLRLVIPCRVASWAMNGRLKFCGSVESVSHILTVLYFLKLFLFMEQLCNLYNIVTLSCLCLGRDSGMHSYSHTWWNYPG